VGDIFLLACLAAFNPTLLAATTVMLLAERPQRMLVGYLCGAMITSITLGLLIVFAFQDSGAASTTQSTLSPAADFTLGGLLLAVSYLLATGYDRKRKERKAVKHPEKVKAKAEKGPPRWQRVLNEGTFKIAFVVGICLTLPGGSYILGLNHIADQDASTAATVAMVLGFNAIMLALLEIPLLAYTLAPDTTPDRVDRFKAWLGRIGRRAAVRGSAIIGGLLVVKGVIGLIQ
jgi:hypothetical protein